jgi:hypothetical protein
MLLWWRGGPLEPAVTRGAQYTLPAVVLFALVAAPYISISISISVSISISISESTHTTHTGGACADTAARWNQGKQGIVSLSRARARSLSSLRTQTQLPAGMKGNTGLLC